MSNTFHRISAILGGLAAIGPAALGDSAPVWAKILIQAVGAVALVLVQAQKVAPVRSDLK